MRDAAAGKAARGSILRNVIRLRQGFGVTSRANDGQGASIRAKWQSKMEPAVGIEPTTRSLQNCCSATELSRLGTPKNAAFRRLRLTPSPEGFGFHRIFAGTPLFDSPMLAPFGAPRFGLRELSFVLIPKNLPRRRLSRLALAGFSRFFGSLALRGFRAACAVLTPARKVVFISFISPKNAAFRRLRLTPSPEGFGFHRIFAGTPLFDSPMLAPFEAPRFGLRELSFVLIPKNAAFRRLRLPPSPCGLRRDEHANFSQGTRQYNITTTLIYPSHRRNATFRRYHFRKNPLEKSRIKCYFEHNNL